MFPQHQRPTPTTPCRSLPLALTQLYSSAGFTLLEALLVLAVLALVAGGAVLATESARDNSESRTIAYTIKTLHQTIETFTAMRGVAPDNLDALLAVTPSSCTTKECTTISGPGMSLGNLSQALSSKLSDPTLTTAQHSALAKAGITTTRYVHLAGNDNDCMPADAPCAANALTGMVAADGSPNPQVANITHMDIPNRVFDRPAMSGKNRGRGFAHRLAPNDPVAKVNDPTLNTKVGAAPGDVLLAFGLGNHSTLVQEEAAATGPIGLAAAPTAPNVCKHHYARFIVVYNVGAPTAPKPKAELVAVLDANGRTLDDNLEGYAPPVC